MGKKSTSELLTRLGISEAGLTAKAQVKAIDGLLPNITGFLKSTVENYEPADKEIQERLQRQMNVLRKRCNRKPNRKL